MTTVAPVGTTCPPDYIYKLGQRGRDDTWKIPPSCMEIKTMSLLEITNYLSKFKPENMPFLTGNQLNALTNQQLISLTTPQLQALTPAQISSMNPSQIIQLTPAQFQSLLPGQLAALSDEQINAMSVEQANTLTAEQTASMPAAQLATLQALIKAAADKASAAQASAAQASAAQASAAQASAAQAVEYQASAAQASAAEAAQVAADQASAAQASAAQASAAAMPYVVIENGGPYLSYIQQVLENNMTTQDIQAKTRLQDGTQAYWGQVLAELKNNNLPQDAIGAKRWLCSRGYLKYCDDYTPYMIALANCDQSAIRTYSADPSSQFLQIGQELARIKVSADSQGARTWLCKNGKSYYCSVSGAAAPKCTVSLSSAGTVTMVGGGDPNEDINKIYAGDYPSLPVIRAIANGDSSYDFDPVTPTSLAYTLLRSYGLPENAEGAKLFLCITRAECSLIALPDSVKKDITDITKDGLKNNHSIRDMLASVNQTIASAEQAATAEASAAQASAAQASAANAVIFQASAAEASLVEASAAQASAAEAYAAQASAARVQASAARIQASAAAAAAEEASIAEASAARVQASAAAVQASAAAVAEAEASAAQAVIDRELALQASAAKAITDQAAEDEAAASAGPYTVKENGGVLAPFMKEVVASSMGLPDIQAKTRLTDGTQGNWGQVIAELVNNNLTPDCVGAKRWLCTRGYLSYCPDFTPYMIALANCDQSAISSYHIDPASQFLQVGQELAKNNLAKNASGARKWLCKNGNSYYCNASGAAAPICSGNRDPSMTSYDVGQIYVGDYPSLRVIRAIASNDSSYDRNPVTPTSLANTILRTFEIPENAKGAQLFLCATRGECDAIAGSAASAAEMNTIVMDSLRNQYSTRDILIRLRKNQSFIDDMFAPSAAACTGPGPEAAAAAATAATPAATAATAATTTPAATATTATTASAAAAAANQPLIYTDGSISSNNPLKVTETVGHGEISSYTIRPSQLPSTVNIEGLPSTITQIVIKDDNYVYPSFHNRSALETSAGFPGSPTSAVKRLPGYISNPVGYIVGFVDPSVGIQTAVVINARFGPSNFGSAYHAVYIDLDRELPVSKDMIIYYGPPGTVFIDPSVQPADIPAAIASARRILAPPASTTPPSSTPPSATLPSANLAESNFTNTNSPSNFINTNLANNFTNANSPYTNVINANQEAANLTNANSPYTNLTNANSPYTNLTNANQEAANQEAANENFNSTPAPASYSDIYYRLSALLPAIINLSNKCNTSLGLPLLGGSRPAKGGATQSAAMEILLEIIRLTEECNTKVNDMLYNTEICPISQNASTFPSSMSSSMQFGGADDSPPSLSTVYSRVSELETNIQSLSDRCSASAGPVSQFGGGIENNIFMVLDNCIGLINGLLGNEDVCPVQSGGRRKALTRKSSAKKNRVPFGRKSKKAPRKKLKRTTRRKGGARR